MAKARDSKEQRLIMDAQRYYDALKKIARQYQTADQLRRHAGQYGCSFEEELVMSYENIQGVAEHAIKRKRPPMTDRKKLTKAQIGYLRDMEENGGRLPVRMIPLRTARALQDRGLVFVSSGFWWRITESGRTALKDKT